VTASLFGSAHSVFHTLTSSSVVGALLAIVAVFFLATVYWVNKDARRRIDQPVLVGAATLLGAIPPFLGPLAYMLLRPPEYLEDVRERELEIQAIESRLGGSSLRCGVCGSDVEDDFLVCPVCTTKLRQACTSCGRPLEPSWQVCPYCETPAGIDAPVTLANAPRTPRAPRSTRSRSAG
jgi:RNA polymerase subunit RPABC4/transcription elongation factor Spt4